MSVLEFIVAIKWPVTVLLLSSLAVVALKRSPGTRASMGAWLRDRNLRLRVAGQEFEAMLAETSGNLVLAAESDSELAAGLAEVAEEPDGSPFRQTEQEAVEIARRAAVENVLNSAVRLGWQLASAGRGTLPDVTVRWTDHGDPVLELDEYSLAQPLAYPGSRIPWSVTAMARKESESYRAHLSAGLRDQERRIRILRDHTRRSSSDTSRGDVEEAAPEETP